MEYPRPFTVTRLPAACAALLLAAAACAPEPESKPVCIVQAKVPPPRAAAFYEALQALARADGFRIRMNRVDLAESSDPSSEALTGQMEAFELVRRDFRITGSNPFGPANYEMGVFRTMRGSAPPDEDVLRLAKRLATAAGSSGAHVPPISLVTTRPTRGGTSFCIIPTETRVGIS